MSAPTASQFDVKKSTTGFECSMTGYTTMVLEITELVLIVFSMYKEIIASMLPPDLKKAFKYFYKGLTGVSSWIGFLIAAVYFLAEDQGYGNDLCEISGYGDVVVHALYEMIDFGSEDGDMM